MRHRMFMEKIHCQYTLTHPRISTSLCFTFIYFAQDFGSFLTIERGGNIV